MAASASRAAICSAQRVAPQQRRKAARDGSPLIELSLFRVKSFAAGIAVQTVFGVALGVFFLVWTLYMQIGLGWSLLLELFVLTHALIQFPAMESARDVGLGLYPALAILAAALVMLYQQSRKAAEPSLALADLPRQAA